MNGESMAFLTSLALLAHARRDSHALVDSRKRTSTATWPLTNDAFDTFPLPPDASDDELARIRGAIGARYAVVIDDREARADQARRCLAGAGMSATVLEDGLLGWTQAVASNASTCTTTRP